jgi:hypothetical protein
MRAHSKQILICLILVCLAFTGAALWIQSARSKEAASTCEKNLELIQGAKFSWARELGKSPDAQPTWEDICPYTGILPGDKDTCPLRCPSGGNYMVGQVADFARCSVHGFLIYVVDGISGSNPYKNGITGAVVETFSGSGRKSESHTGTHGSTFLKIPSNQLEAVTISKPGFVTISNSAQWFMTNTLVALERAPK